VRAEREADPLEHAQVVRNVVESGVEGLRTLAHRLVEQVLLRLDVRVQRPFLDAHRLGEVSDRGAVVAPLGEEAGRLTG
jgi:hypothetical protein